MNHKRLSRIQQDRIKRGLCNGVYDFKNSICYDCSQDLRRFCNHVHKNKNISKLIKANKNQKIG